MHALRADELCRATSKVGKKRGILPRARCFGIVWTSRMCRVTPHRGQVFANLVRQMSDLV
eukprot:12375089-Heterocapsa_arctica.AAC.1